MSTKARDRIAALSPEKQDELMRKLREKNARPKQPSIPLRPKGTASAPLSFAQQRLWFLDQLEPGSATYNLPAAVRMEGSLDVGALEHCFAELARRHESLRTTFHAGERGVGTQVVSESATLSLRHVDLRELPAEQREAEARKLSALELQRPFDLSTGPLLRATLVKLAEQDHVLILAMHHIVSDGWSLGVLIRELVMLYTAFSRGQPSPLPEPVLQYADFACWQREWLQGEVLETQLAYWKKQLDGAPRVLELPTDRPRPPVQSYRGASLSVRLPRELSEALKALGKQEGATPFMVLLAGFGVLLQRYAGQEDLCIGTPIAGRNRAELEGLIGFFINTLVLRIRAGEAPTFRQLLAQVKETTVKAYAHQDLPFEKLVDTLHPERDLSRSPLFQVLFTLQNAPMPQVSQPGFTLRTVEVESTTAKFDLSLAFTDTAEGFVGSLDYSTDLFEASTAARMMEHLKALLEGLVARPDQRLGEVPLLSQSERQRLLVSWNDTKAELPREACAHRLFEAQVARTPQAPAVAFGEETLTYAQLDQRANRLAHHLRSLGVGPETRVGLCLERSLDVPVAMLAILKAGGAFVPLDPAYPAARLSFIFGDAGISLLVTRKGLLASVPEGIRQVSLDAEAQAIALQPDTAPASGTGEDNLAYVIYTSGSTGMPKGTLLVHRGLCNTALAAVKAHRFRPDSRVLQFASPSFDASVCEVFSTLLAGACLVLASREELLPDAALRSLLEKQSVTAATLTPSVLAQLSEEGLPKLETIISAGEALPQAVARRWTKGRTLLNAYGPTEVTICASISGPVDPEQLTIGRPFPNVALYVLDGGLQPVPVGAPGELYVGGVGLARGYLGRPELTAERFIPHPFSAEPGARLYKTGDRVRYLADGQLEFLGRADTQVKVRGFRIEPGEVEAVLLQHSAVREAVVVAREDVPGNKRLVAYVTGDAQALGSESLRAFLKERLPEHMVPAAFVTLPALPLTSSGKLDRKALPAPDARPELKQAFVAPRNDVEQKLATIWAQVLGLQRVGIHDNIFELGGDSISSLQVISRARQVGLHLTPKQIFQRQTIAELAPLATAAQAIQAEQGVVTGPVPLTPIQRAFLESGLPKPHHFNQSVLLETREPVDAALLERALRKLVQHHDALRMRFVQEDGGWRQVNTGLERNASILQIDLSSVPEAEQAAALEAEAAKVQASFELSEGLLLRAALFHRGPQRTGRLLLVAHHLVVDTVSWRTLMEDLDSAYRALKQGREPSLQPKTTSFKAWAERLEAHARSEALEAELPYWLSEARQQVRPLPVDQPGGVNSLASVRMVSAALDAAETRLLLQEVPAAYRARINDVLLTALAQACAAWTGQSRMLVDLEGHGREDLFDDVDLSRTVGWFTSVTPVLLELPPSASPGDALRSVRDGLRQLPSRGLGHGLLRYLGREEVTRKLAALPKAQVAFNYLGQMDGAANSSPLFGLARESAGAERASGADRGHLLEVSGVVIDGQLRLSFAYSSNLHTEATLQGLASAFVASLRTIISGRTAPDALRYTPADFPLARLSAETLDRLLPPATPIEDVYPLSPLQQGMLFHSLLAPSAGFYFEQLSWAFHSPIDMPAFRRAWDALVEQHAILRTGFFWDGLPEPLQVVYPRASLPYEEHDWRGLSKAGQQEKLAAYIAADRSRGIDLRRPPLMRLAVMRLDENVLQFVWSHHHLLMDGWSIGLMLNELFARYDDLRAGRQRAARIPPFRDYIEWLQQQPIDRAEAYWSQTLRGFTTPTPLPAARAVPAGSQARSKERRKLFLTPAATTALNAFARQHQLTVNTLVQGTFGLLLGRYSGESDVVFGTIVSGRPPELPGIEQMIGMFINSVPVRVRLSDDETILPWLQRVQAQQTERSAYEYTPLMQIQGWSDVPRGSALFDSLLVFENYPVDGAVRERGSSFDVRDIETYEHNNFPLDAAVTLGQTLGLHLTYDTQRYEGATIERLLNHWAAALEDVISRPERRLSEISLLTAEERQKVLVEWNATAADYPKDSCVHELFEAQAALRPDAIAVEFGSQRLTYRQLDARANQLAHFLRRQGVGPDSRVALCVDRSLELIVSLLGILKAGGAYVPLDSAYPRERLSFMLEDSRPQVLVTTRALLSALPAEGLSSVLLDEVQEALAQEPTSAPRSGVLPQHLAYIDFTSGSTGRPKGVCIEHRSVLRTVLGVHYAHLGPEETFLLIAPISFDASTLEVWGPLLNGARLVVFPPHAPGDVHELADVLARHRVTTLHLTSGLFTQMVDAHLEGLRPVKQLLTGGDVVSAPHVQRVLETLHIPITACYGPTESTLFASCFRMTQPSEVGASVPIGRPISNTQVYILDRHLQPVPAGVPGELFISGDGLARGYLGSSSLTAERFLPNPFSAAPGARMYRTGDLARHRHDGVLEFLGRIDNQVKVRGFRIELAEVESALLSHASVREAVVVAREDRPGDKRLVAYTVLNTPRPPGEGRGEGIASPELNPESLRAFLKQRLPEYMVPSAFVHLEALPLTSHGKVDRKALPAPDSRPELAQAFVAPRNDVEQKLASIWAEVLRLERVGIHDNFFELGGHSLLATRAISRIRGTFSVELPLRDLFDAPTVATLGARLQVALQRQQGPKAPPMVPVSRTGRLPLSFAQQRLWFLDQLEPNNAAYNMPTAVGLDGALDLAALERSFNELVRRHESLRTTFRNGPEGATQVIAPAVQQPLPVVELTGLPEGARDAEARRLAIQEAQRPFDLARGPLLRTLLLRLGEHQHVLLVTMHHIISDGWSMALLIREMGLLYEAFSTGRPSPLPELPLQYADYAAWQQGWLQGEVLEAQLTYWREHLAGAPQVLELPTDHPRPATQSHRGATRSARLPLPLTEGLQELARAEGVTPFMLVLTAFQVLLHRYSGQEDLVIGTDVANRHHAELEGLVGFFVNQLALRSRLSGDPTFRELLGRTRDSVLGGQAHQDLPFEELVRALNPERSLRHAPLFQVKLTYQTTPQGGAMELPGLSLRGLGTEEESTVAKIDLTLVVSESSRGLSCVCEYATDLFEAGSIDRLLAGLRVLLEGAVADAGQRVSTMSLLSEEERHKLLVEWNATDASLPPEARAHELFEAQAERTPDAVALSFEDSQLTYRELNRRANQLAHHLRTLGVGQESRVGLCVERSLELVVGALGVLKAGGAFVPLDPSYPQERLAFMMRDAALPLVLTQERLADELPSQGELLICLDSEWARIALCSEDTPRTEAAADPLAYVIYTSGSTGQPKGTLLTHRGLCNTALAAARVQRLGPDSRVLQFAASGFDASIWEMFSALLSGAHLCLAPRDSLMPGAPLQALIQTRGITAATLTPSVLAQLEPDAVSGLRTVTSAGEACTPELARRWKPGRRFLNAYGPTEVTVCATVCEDVDEARPGIGRPLPNVQVYVLDARLQPVPIGVPGELYVGGVGLARGYLNRPELTAERFVSNPFRAQDGARLYRTGDLVRYRADGQLEYLGRIDNQVKVRGFRIELGEIEAALEQHPTVRQAAVVAREDVPGDKRLVAYVVGRDGQHPDAGELRAWVARTLPQYMVPSALVELEALPLTPNGKVDRKALPSPEGVRPDTGPAFVAPRDEVEQQLAAMWSELLGVERVGVHDNFFDLGGHSLLATQLVSRVRATCGVELPLRDLFDAPTIAALAPRVHAALQTRQGVQAPPLVPVPRTGRLPLSFAQQRLWFLDQLEPNNAAYNLPTALRLEGMLDLAALERSFNELIRRHESLRTTFRGDPEGATQVISPAEPRPLPVMDLSGLPEDEREAEAWRLAVQETQLPFDLARGPLVRTLLLRLGERQHVLLVTMHHIISDGWSMAQLTREMGLLYAAFSSGKPSPLPELAVQYADYAAWQQGWLQGEVLDAQLSWWREHLAGAAQVLELPTDRPRPAVRSHRGATRSVMLPASLSDRVRELARAEGVTPFMLLLAAFQVLLQRYSGQDEFVVGTDVANRHHAELESLIGFFVNQLALRADLGGDPTFRELLGRTRDSVLGGQAHQDLPFEELVRALNPERSLRHAPLFQVKLMYQTAPHGGGMELPGLTLRALETAQEAAVAKLDITLVIGQTPRGLSCVCEYATDLFDADTIGRMLEHFHVLLEALTTEPGRRLSSLPLLTQAERHQLLVEWNTTRTDFPRDVRAQHLFEAQARRTPDALAVRMGEASLTYRQLDARANQLAWHLRSLGVGPDVRVGLCVERSPDLVVAILGVLKAGGAYVPLDPSYPSERLAFMLRDARIPVLLTQEHLADELPVQSELLVLLDAEWDTLIAAQPEHAPDVPVLAENLAYVIYTSGSTGRPKGVMLEHLGLVNYLSWCARAYGMDEGTGAPTHSPLAFDLTVTSLLLPLTTGRPVTLVPESDSVEGLGAALRSGSDFSLVKLTPTHLSLLSQQLSSEQAAGRTRAFVIGGEALTYEALSFWRTHAPATRLLNEYGPTETVVGCCVHEVSAAEASSGAVPIGRPIANVELHVLDSQLRLVPVGVPGELYIGGVPLARGYLGRPELTAEKFVPHPFSSVPGARLYRTGDLARRRADGVLEFLGRADEQVKVRGFRIELGEIESVLASHPAVREVAVVVREDVPGDKRLVAYVTGEANDLGTPELRRVLESKLPAYMVPSAFVVLEALPLTPNGKVDRKALPAPDGLRSETRDFVTPRDVLELQLAQVFEEVLGAGPIGAKSDFFELGGHSLLAVQLLRRIEQATGQSLPMSALFEGATVEHLAHLLRQEPRPWTPLVPMGREEGGRPFFCVHPVGGNVLCYAELARALGPELRFYGLQAPGLEGEQAPLETFEALAATYVAAVRTVQPHGPYLLGGWSMGGGLALEMAQQLQRQGEQVELLAVIDGYAGAPEGLLPPEDAAAVMTALFAQHLAAVTGEGTMMPDEALAGMEPEQMLQHLLEEGRKSAAVTPDTELPRLRALRQVFASNQRASAAWRPGPYAGSIELFRTTDPGKDVADQERSWKQLARDGVVVHDVPGDHYSVLRAPHVQLLARLLKESLARIRTGEEEQAKQRA